MEFSYRIGKETVCIDKIENPGAVVVVPEEIDGRPVTELGAYVLSGTGVEEVYLPSRLVKIGAYGFYGCEALRKIHCFGRLTDLGTGLFAGVQSVEYLEYTEFLGERSGLKDLLSELRQTLWVKLFRQDENGRTAEARLIFPEYFEESVENTPARILFIETHGCGHRYRYCFVNRQFQFRGYDELFPHVKVQEPERLVTELALGRLLYPLELGERFRDMYREYIKEHWQEAGRLLIEADGKGRGEVSHLEPGKLPWLVNEFAGELSQVEAFLSMAGRAEDTEMVSWLMDYRHGLLKDRTPLEEENGKRRRRKFEL